MEPAKVVRRHRQSPGRVERAVGGEPAGQATVRAEDIHESVARPRLVVLVVRTELFGKCDEEPPANVPNVERGEAGLGVRVRKRARPAEGTVEHIDPGVVEIRCVKQGPVACVGQGDALVDRVGRGIVRHHHCITGIHIRVPGQDLPRLGRVKEPGGVRVGAVANQKIIRRPVDRDSGGFIVRPDRHTNRRPVRPVKRGEVTVIVGDDQGAPPADDESPGINQVGISIGGLAGHIADEMDLLIAGSWLSRLRCRVLPGRSISPAAIRSVMRQRGAGQ